ncbi:DEAD/DEAH box helicase [Prochlorothrix hollandica]|nr:DEAD/DEAH box helicase [Prochlorothrix hollandica]
MNNPTASHLLDSRVATAFYGSFKSLRPIQEAVIKPLLNEENVILASGTGSGKTEAVMAPLVSRYWKQAVQKNVLILLYISPTKALVNDLEKRLSHKLSSLGIKVGVRHGDRDDLKQSIKPHILITTPESLEVILIRNDQTLDNIKCLVFDEIHLLYNTQRGMQLSVLAKRLESKINHNLQRVALSATIGSFDGISKVFFSQSSEVKILSFPTSRPIDSHIRYLYNSQELLPFIQQLFKGRKKTKFLIFVNSRKKCEILADVLRKDKYLEPGIFTHYSSLSKDIRLDIENRFSNTSANSVCIATNTLELGIDIGDIDAVILWDPPYRIDSFLQRIGRSNRRENKTNVICLITKQETKLIDCLLFMAFIDAAKHGKLPIYEPYELFGAINQQCFSVLLGKNGQYTKVKDFLEIFDSQDYLSRDILEKILDASTEQEYLVKHGFKNQYGAGRNLYFLKDQRLIYGNFALSTQTVEIKHSSKVIGEVPMENIFKLSINEVIRFAGTQWKIKKISKSHIEVTPSKFQDCATNLSYNYSSSLIRETFIFHHIWEMIHNCKLDLKIIEKSLRNDIFQLVEIFRKETSYNQVPMFFKNSHIHYYTFAGSLVNYVLATSLNLKNSGFNDIVITTTTPIEWNKISTDPENYTKYFKEILFSQELSIYQELLPTELKQVEAIQQWLKDLTIKKILKRLSISSECQVSQLENFP